MADSVSSSSSVSVTTAQQQYEIQIGQGLFDDSALWQGLPDRSQAVVVSNPVVASLHMRALVQRLASVHSRTTQVLLPDGEQHKNQASLDLIYDHLLAEQCDRRTVLYALGGGVVGDITGFAAATYMRGIAFVQVPTTLMAQVDSSVGGKTAINHERGKNMIGAFHQPLRVFCDLNTLDTLPQREFASGLAEVIKYGPIADPAFLDWTESHLDRLLRREPSALRHAVQRSCEVKAQVVGADEREGGLRAILNFGHTFGHAIETGLGYGQWLHGEAVACGMILAAELSERLGGDCQGLAGRLRTMLQSAGLPVTAPAMPAERWLQLMRIDKKAEAGAMRFVVIEAPGRAALRAVPDALVCDVLRHHGASMR